MRHNNGETGRPVAVDLFAGAGGMSLGFEQAGFDVAAAVEMDPVHCAVHEYNFPQCAVVCRNIAEVSGAELRRRVLGRRGKISVVFGGPPCQGFSMMGKRVLDDPRNRLVREFLRIVVETEAPYFALENVRGLTVGKHRQVLDELAEEFDREGYALRLPWRVLNAAHFGVPQDRRRLFLIGARKGLPLPAYPEPRFGMPGDNGDLFPLPPVPAVLEALSDLPDADDFEELLHSDKVRAALGEPSRYAAVLRGLVRDASDFSIPRDFDARWMTSSLRTEHTGTSRRRFADTAHGRVEPVSRFFKLDPAGIANTLRAGTGSDRGAFTSPRPIHPFYPRCITVREMARLHSYPDWFRFHATKWHGARQVGNSVPPLLARAVASAIADALGLHPRKPRGKISLGGEGLLSMSMQEACAHFGVPADTIPQRTRACAAARG